MGQVRGTDGDPVPGPVDPDLVAGEGGAAVALGSLPGQRHFTVPGFCLQVQRCRGRRRSRRRRWRRRRWRRRRRRRWRRGRWRWRRRGRRRRGRDFVVLDRHPGAPGRSGSQPVLVSRLQPGGDPAGGFGDVVIVGQHLQRRRLLSGPELHLLRRFVPARGFDHRSRLRDLQVHRQRGLRRGSPRQRELHGLAFRHRLGSLLGLDGHQGRVRPLIGQPLHGVAHLVLDRVEPWRIAHHTSLARRHREVSLKMTLFPLTRTWTTVRSSPATVTSKSEFDGVEPSSSASS